MADTINTGWLHDKDENRFAPKTLSSQVITNDGVSLEDALKEEIISLKSKVDELESKVSEFKSESITIGNATLSYSLTESALVISFS